MLSPKNSQDYKRRYSSSSSSSSKRKRTTKRRKTSTKRRKGLYGRIKWNRVKKAHNFKYSGGRTVNVKNDSEIYNKTKFTLPVTNRQQKIINKRFKEGYSPFERNLVKQIQLTNFTETNKAKYIWRTYSTLDLIRKAFEYFPQDSSTPGTVTSASSDTYLKSEEQSVYINAVSNSYEILNPTNYDVTMVVYDIVYKEDTTYSAGNYHMEDLSALTSVRQDPIHLIKTGLDNFSGHMESAGTETTSVIVGDSVQSTLALDSIEVKPTMSYPFNIYCKIIRKQTFRLQPGATMTHLFKYRPKALINRGYLYKYKNFFEAGNSEDIAIKNLTCGSLFKIYGQLANTGDNTLVGNVANLAGRLCIKERTKVNYYCMDNKYKYIFKEGTEFTPENPNQMEIVNDMEIKPAQEINLVSTDNTNQSIQT